MKIRQLLVFFCFISLVMAANAQSAKFSKVYATGSRLYVYANAGLSLRSNPDPKAEVLEVIKFGEIVQVEPDDHPPVAITNSGISGSWVKVSYQDKTGYQFDGFLSRFPPPTSQEIEPYLRSLFDVRKENSTHPTTETYNMYKEIFFTNGSSFLWSAPVGSNELMVVIPASIISFQEAYLLARFWYPEYIKGDVCAYKEGATYCSQDVWAITIEFSHKKDKYHPVPSYDIIFASAD